MAVAYLERRLLAIVAADVVGQLAPHGGRRGRHDSAPAGDPGRGHGAARGPPPRPDRERGRRRGHHHLRERGRRRLLRGRDPAGHGGAARGRPGGAPVRPADRHQPRRRGDRRRRGLRRRGERRGPAPAALRARWRPGVRDGLRPPAGQARPAARLRGRAAGQEHQASGADLPGPARRSLIPAAPAQARQPSAHAHGHRPARRAGRRHGLALLAVGRRAAPGRPAGGGGRTPRRRPWRRGGRPGRGEPRPGRDGRPRPLARRERGGAGELARGRERGRSEGRLPARGLDPASGRLLAGDRLAGRDRRRDPGLLGPLGPAVGRPARVRDRARRSA